MLSLPAWGVWIEIHVLFYPDVPPWSLPAWGALIESDRMKMLTVKYQTPEGIYFSYALQNENLFLDKKCMGYADDKNYRLIGAYYGNENKYLSVMQKMRHYEYFKWDKIEVNHENFPSNTASDDTETLHSFI